eukprot:CAMPEP_0115553548 /NCGR_PEP_ID=MMETSP0271-20121206/96833_1 /TAXON_ID=71861 /ORGANISM="Scrippsiella trochoidea, Strain CCMP3099" /LENGTH=110 /DNA_ID=CAMNT_0002987243 /DNA_START=55 /DNA_END=388 /DNA_ORIENTATION=+
MRSFIEPVPLIPPPHADRLNGTPEGHQLKFFENPFLIVMLLVLKPMENLDSWLTQLTLLGLPQSSWLCADCLLRALSLLGAGCCAAGATMARSLLSPLGLSGGGLGLEGH